MMFSNVDGWSLLHLAVASGDFDEVKNLIENHHVDVNCLIGGSGDSALFLALLLEYEEIANYLLQHGASIGTCR